MTLQAWLATRTPSVPGAFRVWMRPGHPDDPASVEALAREAEEALDRALAPAGRPRRGAFDLLAADGFLTYACEAALEEEDPADALDGLLRRLIP